MLFLLKLDFIVGESGHEPPFHLFCFQLDVFAGKLFLLEQSEFLLLLQLANLTCDVTFGLRRQLLLDCFDFPLERLVDLVDLLGFGPSQGLLDYLKLVFFGVASFLSH